MRAKHGNWSSGEITSAEMLLMFLFPCVDQGSRARLFSCLLGNCSFLLQAESSGCSSTLLLLHAYSCLPLDGLSYHHDCLVVEGEAWWIPGCIHKYRATTPSSHTCLSCVMGGELTGSGAHHVLRAAAAGCRLPSSWCPCPPSLLPGEGTHTQYSEITCWTLINHGISIKSTGY